MISFQNVSARVESGNNLGASLDSVTVELPDTGLIALTGSSIGDNELFFALIAGMIKPDSGEISIAGKDTSSLTEADWNNLRSTKISYIKQGNNLLQNSTAAGNVEFALKMAGVPKIQRKQRIRDAFETTGFIDCKNSKVNELTREQIVRLYIARSIASDHKIILLTNPLDRLDIKATDEILSLLQECSKSRLVVISSHNISAVRPFAHRVLNIEYGKLSEDIVLAEQQTTRIFSPKGGSRTKALSCSFGFAMKGVKTRVGRTIILCVTGILLFAVVALIISFRTGALDFLAMSEENTLTQYPVVAKGDNLARLKSTIDSGATNIPSYTQAIEYGYDFDPMIYVSDTSKGIYQANPSSLITLIYSLTTASQQNTSNFDATQSFHELPSKASLYENNFDVVAGTWPTSSTDIVIVLDSDGKMDNYLFYLLGINDYDSLVTSLDKSLDGETVTLPTGASEYDSATLLNRTFKMVMKSDCYVKNDSTGTWRNKTYNEQFMKQLVDNGTTLTVCGVVKPKASMETASDYKGICYSSKLKDYVSNYNLNSRIVQEQLAKPETNVLTGRSFADEAADIEQSDEEKAQSAISALAWLLDVDESSLNPDNIDVEALMNSAEVKNFMGVVSSFDANSIDTSSFNMNGMPEINLEKVLTLSEIEKVKTHPEVISEVFSELLYTYLDVYIEAESSGKNPPSFSDFMETDQAQKIFNRLKTDLIDTSALSPDSQQKVADYITSYLTNELAPYLIDKAITCVKAIVTPIANHATNVVIPYLEGRINALTNHVTSTMTSQLSNELGFDVTSLTDENASISLKTYFISGLLNSLSDPRGSNCSENISTFGYIDMNNPSSIKFYAKSVSSKEKLNDRLAKYNQEVEAAGSSDLKVTYFDLAGSATDVASIIVTKTANLLLILLIIFFIFGIVAIHLSMRAVTFESRYPASLLRRLGGGKRHVFAMYMFEAIFDGLIFSVVGIIIAVAICGSLSNFIQDGTGLDIVFYMTWYSVLLLISLGILMGFVGALGPALQASRKNISEYAF